MSMVADVKNNLRMTNVMGHGIPFKRFEGINYNFWSFIPENIDEHLKMYRNLEILEDDIFICTYPRSGTSWTNEIVNMLLKQTPDYCDTMFEFIDMYPKEKIDSFKSPRVFVSHFPFRYLPKQLEEKGRIISVYRNPKDLAVSLHIFLKSVNFADYNGTWDDFYQMFLDGNLPGGLWFDYILEWEKDIAEHKMASILTLNYEDMSTDLQGNVAKIAEYLGLPNDAELFTAISEKCRFTNMYKQKQAHIPPGVVTCSKTNANYLYRKGQVGNWKKWFTMAQNEKFEAIFNERMKDSKMEFKFSL